jgi:Flp pilus assembly protein TadD
MIKNSDKSWSLLICLALAFATAAVFWQVYAYDFVNFDDPTYIYENPNIQSGITLKAIKWAFTTDRTGYWHPLTWLSFMLDYQLFKGWAGGYHLVNVLFHIINTLLLFYVLMRMTGAVWPSAFVAAAFALHPLHVESVVWISERKDVLGVFFWLLATWAYIRFVNRPKIIDYLLVIIFLALGLMAKPMLVTLPFALLLLDYWPLERLSSKYGNTGLKRSFFYLLIEKVPLFAIVLASCIATFIAQRVTGAMRTTEEYGFPVRLANAFISYAKYIEKMIWPVKLTFFYPHPGLNVSVLYAVISAVLLLVVTILILRFAKKRKYLVTGWFWYLGTLIPVIGIVQVGMQAYADRYSYITLTGLFVIIAWGVWELFAKFRYKKIVLIHLALLTIAAMSICTWFQIHYWQNSLVLFQHALDVDADNYIAHGYMTQPLLDQGRIDEAIWHNSQALRIKPDYIDALNGMGVALHEAGRMDEAVVYYKKAIEIDPHTFEANANLGVVLASEGKFAEAIEHYKIAMTTMDTPRIHRNYAQALFNLGRFPEAVAEYRKTLLTMPNDPNVINELGYALAHTGKFDEAITLYNKALRISPDNINIHLNLGTALTGSGKFDEAVKEYDKIIRIQPNNAVAHNDFGVVLYRLEKLDDAVAQFRQAVQINPEYTDAKNNLNTVLAEKQKSSNNAVESNKK